MRFAPSEIVSAGVGCEQPHFGAGPRPRSPSSASSRLSAIEVHVPHESARVASRPELLGFARRIAPCRSDVERQTSARGARVDPDGAARAPFLVRRCSSFATKVRTAPSMVISVAVVAEPGSELDAAAFIAVAGVAAQRPLRCSG